MTLLWHKGGKCFWFFLLGLCGPSLNEPLLKIFANCWDLLKLCNWKVFLFTSPFFFHSHFHLFLFLFCYMPMLCVVTTTHWHQACGCLKSNSCSLWLAFFTYAKFSVNEDLIRTDSVFHWWNHAWRTVLQSQWQESGDWTSVSDILSVFS